MAKDRYGRKEGKEDRGIEGRLEGRRVGRGRERG
jgi:hypothetical protein